MLLQSPHDDKSTLEQVLATARKVVIFTGSGLSASSGMSTFSTKGGLYERAQKRFRVVDGKSLFTYAFYAKHPRPAQAFLAEVHGEAVRATPAPGHYALALLSSLGRLSRHYTLNIDGLSQRASSAFSYSKACAWHPDDNPGGLLVELHGSIHQLVCGACGATRQAAPAQVSTLRAEGRVACPCGDPAGMRFRVMLYDDAEGERITPDAVLDVMEGDVKAADVVLWVGISFQQSASTHYFRCVRRWLAEAGRTQACPQAVVNPSDEAVWNLRTASSNLCEQ
ncbi:hypothetical protein APUTEX25_000204 [Auxenochlorella protothecoides]|uniref:Deacetylase sirtuin-type domain-containing protein n=1 Tax=Auxenochlorella protothecoides TaxID=3075 RepID=A0A3M7KYR8_AUXPR|nr:hypothetical protein APUTEX25_000204 [Auxenochlorella protothecoides]|eukprot:RMZ55621.1 hypothetical protein APUTEX25_000204 [Auxenochlorella protothecoides]